MLDTVFVTDLWTGPHRLRSPTPGVPVFRGRRRDPKLKRDIEWLNVHSQGWSLWFAPETRVFRLRLNVPLLISCDDKTGPRR